MAAAPLSLPELQAVMSTVQAVAATTFENFIDFLPSNALSGEQTRILRGG
jgi:hypothetical protein